MYPRSQERRRNREATVYLPALGGDGPRLDRTIRIYTRLATYGRAAAGPSEITRLPDLLAHHWGTILTLLIG